MAIKALWTFAHLSGITTQNTAGGALAYTKYSMTYNNTVGGASAGVTAAGWYSHTAVTTSGTTTIGRSEIVLNTVADWTTKSTWMGFGYMGTNTAGTDPQTVLSWLLGAAGTTKTNILSESEFPAGFNRGQQYWVEMQIDRVGLNINVYIDGVFLKAIPITAATIVAASTLLLGHGAQVGAVDNTSVRYFRDIYFLDDTSATDTVATQCTRLGPQSVVPLTVSSATGSGWANGLGSALSAPLNAALTGTPPTPATYDTSPLTQNALSASLAVGGTLQSQQTIQAVSLVVTAQKGAGSSSYLKNSVTDGTNTKALTSINFASTAWSYNAAIGIMEKAPDGTAWTAAKIAAASLVMTPSTTA